MHQGPKIKIPTPQVGGRPREGAKRLGILHRKLGDTGDCAGDVVLKREDIVELAFEPVGPDLIADESVDEVHRYPHALSGLADTALEHIAHAQLLGGFRGRNLLPLEAEAGAGVDDEQRPIRVSAVTISSIRPSTK